MTLLELLVPPSPKIKELVDYIKNGGAFKLVDGYSYDYYAVGTENPVKIYKDHHFLCSVKVGFFEHIHLIRALEAQVIKRAISK